MVNTVRNSLDNLLHSATCYFRTMGIQIRRNPHPPPRHVARLLFPLLVLAALLCFMSNGTLLWYMVAWQQLIRHFSVLQFAVGWTPFGIFNTIGAVFSAWLIPLLAAQWILAIGALSVLISNLLLTTMPAQQTYWAQVFPATILMAFCPDFVYMAAQIIASNSVRRRSQGVAASLIGTLNLYGNSLGLGFAGTVETEINDGQGGVKGYRAALYFGVAIARWRWWLMLRW
jgi:hypothetical protein